MDKEENNVTSVTLIRDNPEAVIKESKLDKETPIDVLIQEEKTESITQICSDLGNNEVITMAPQENVEEIIIYDKNGEVSHTEETSEYVENIQECSLNSCIGTDDDSIEKEIDITEDDGEKHISKTNMKIDMLEHENSVLDESAVWDENVKNENLDKVVEVTNVVNILTDKVKKTSQPKIKNSKNLILEDWDVEVPPKNSESDNFSEAAVVTEEPQIMEDVNTEETITYNDENSSIIKVEATDSQVNNQNEQMKETNSLSETQKENSSASLEGEIIKLMSDTKVDSLKYSKSISKDDIVKILDESSKRVIKPIATGKDLFFSIELAKRLNQKLLANKLLKNSDSEKNNISNEQETCNNNNTVDDRQKIVEILEADEIKDWKSVPSKSDTSLKENGNDMEISKAIKNMEAGDRKLAKPKKVTTKKFRIINKELERKIALQQLREEFPITRKRTRTTKKVNHIPFLASTVLEKAMTSPEVTTALKPGPPKRRPCYLPDVQTEPKPDNSKINLSEKDELNSSNAITKKVKSTIEFNSNPNLLANTNSKHDSDVIGFDLGTSNNSSIPNPVVKTYSAKRKSTDAENNIKTTLETLAVVTKAFNESIEEDAGIKPKKPKTVIKPENNLKKKLVKNKVQSKPTGFKRNSELEKLLGDEGAVRMLYDTQHKDAGSVTPKKKKLKTTTGLKKDLVFKTKLVKNAVMRLSGVGMDGVYLRGKRHSKITKADIVKSEPLFSSTPNIVLYKSKKKQRAEASRILYRHSSSESFDSSEGYRRTSFDADVLNSANQEEQSFGTENVEDSTQFTASDEKDTAKAKAKKAEIFVKKKLKGTESTKQLTRKKKGQVAKCRLGAETSSAESGTTNNNSKLNLSNVPLRKSSRPRVASKKYSIWSSTSMDSLSVESLGLKKIKKASHELGKKLSCKELNILQYENLVHIILNPVSTLLKNSLNFEVLEELTQVFNYLSGDPNCKAILLSSTGNTFCQGIDINHIISVGENERKNCVSQLVKAIRKLSSCLSDFKKPLIAGVHAAAIGLGVTLLPFCDLVVASDKASFYTPYVKLGQAPEGAPTYTFPRISRHLVSELLFKSHKMMSADAVRYGLVTRVIPEERFEEELLVFARNIAAQPVNGMQSIKILLRSGDHEEIVQTLQAEGEMLEKQWTSTECLNNMVKFLNSGELQLKQLDT